MRAPPRKAGVFGAQSRVGAALFSPNRIEAVSVCVSVCAGSALHVVFLASRLIYFTPFCRRMSDNDDIEVDSDADKRAHHNALERKRRDHIKDSFHSLRDSVPSLQGEKVGKALTQVSSQGQSVDTIQQSTKQASRAQILDKATEYIQYMRRKNQTHQQDIDDLKRQNALLEQQVRALEKVKGSTQLQANYSSSDSSLYTNPKGSAVSAFDGGSDSSSESEVEEPPNRKKLRMEAS
ncbi:protein max isoform X4 [Cynoglossus semilaevis]|uniref:Protein max n=1 Tax=Cynoglossus semilaevis TaxID=244447 RepID=A0A3P8UVM4_CYNSE|nr:protein max isoform X4 [Cynoglossus semilaevis]